MPYSGYPFAAKVGQFKPPNWTNSEYRNQFRRRLGDLPQMMVKQQEKSEWVSLCAGSND